MKQKALQIILLVAFLPLAAWADIWQDPQTKVNYEYTPGSGEASVKAGQAYYAAGSPDVSGNIDILSKFTVDGNEYTVTSIGLCAFYSKMRLTSITIPNTVKSIGNRAFSGCGLTSITIPNSITNIGNEVFEMCPLVSFFIPSSVSEIGKGILRNCKKLNSIQVDINNAYYDSRNNCHAIVRTIDNTLVSGCMKTTIPNTIKAIGDEAFSGIGITSIIIPNSLTNIGKSAFESCTSLTSINLPSSLSSIGESAFYGCSELTEISIPKSVMSIGKDAFTKTGWYKNQPDGIIYLNDWLLDIKGSLNDGNVIIKDGVEKIADYALTSWGLVSVIMPNSVKSIGENAFYDCKNLISVHLSDMVTTLESYTFYECSSLESINIPKLLTKIKKKAFYKCSNLQKIIIPNLETWCTLQIDGLFDAANPLDYAHRIYIDEETEIIDLVLPEGLESIRQRAFYGCSNIRSLTIPASVEYISSDAFVGCSLISVTSLNREPFSIVDKFFEITFSPFDDNTYENAILYIPKGSLEAYSTTAGWNNFKNIIEISDGITLTLDVINENGADLSDRVNIVWYDADGKQIGTGKSLNGINDGTVLYYSVVLSEEFGRVYREVKMQKVVANGEQITCQLEKIGRVMLEGRVSATDIERNTMTVSVQQMLNGKYPQNYTTQTNEQGVFSVEVYDDETDITISGEGYLNATFHRDGFSGNGNVGTIPMSLLSGFAIAANITMQKAVADGEATEVSSWTDGLNNIEFTLTNTTKGKAITDFTVQNGNVIIKTGANVDDEIRVEAKSKQGLFADAATTFVIAEGANTFDLQLTELGGLDATYAASSNGNTVGYLYNSNDILVAKGSYAGETISLRHLPSGTYTLVSMGMSRLLGNLNRLSDLSAVGLTEGTDYVASRVDIIDGVVTAVAVSEVPRLDETQFYYTSKNTYFSANKASVTAGNYLTLQAHVDFKSEYADKANSVTLTIDLPEGCQMVENSVIANRQAVPHTVNGNRVTFPLSKEQYESQVRFCVIPTLNQNYTITAMASFDIDGQVQQPIGTAQFEVKLLSLNVPKQTASTNITLNGIAKGYSEVKIYDNNVLIGKTTSKADGSWSADCELYKPYSHSFHDLYAKITTEDGIELTSETRQVEYNKNNLVPEKITMLYFNPEYVGQYNIVFDLINGTTTPSSYYFFPYKNWPDWYITRETEPKVFTFLADFTRNDTTQIKNVSIKVLNSDGTIRTLPATFDKKQNKWVATTKYSSSNRLPQNVKVEYISIPVETEFDSSRIIEDNSQFANLIKNFVTNMDPTQTEIVDANDAMIMYKYQTTTMSQPVYLRLKELNYDQWIDALENMTYFTVEDNGALLYFCDSIISEKHFASWAWSKENKTLLQLELSDSREFPAISPTRNNVPRRAETFLGNIGVALGKSALNLFCGAADIAEIVNEYNAGFAEYSNWLTKYNKTLDDHMSLHKKAQQLVNAKCPDGNLKLYGPAWNSYSYELDDLTRYKAKNMREKFKNNLERVRKDLLSRRNVAMIWASIGQATNLYGVLANGVAATFKEFLKDFIQDSFQGQAADNAWNMLMNNNFYTCEQLSEWYYPANKEITDKYVALMDNIKGSYHECEKEKDEEEEKVEDEEQDIDNNDFRGKGSTPQHDPSGYVYEAVMSNRLEGVTATCYQKVYGEDLYGDPTEEAVVWNAEDYSQVNPQKTDKTGFYRWDVPQGMWQVKYEKEGYETAYSDWLPVPPPQLDVNIGMKQSTPPTVKQMRGFESGINIEMAKYMRPETMTTANITVTRNGAAEKGSIEQLNTEKAPLGEETYVSKVRFVPENRFNTTDLVVVTVHKEAESYCGVKMAKDHVETVKIEPEVKSIVCDSLLTIPYQGTKELNVMVLPKEASAGKTLHVKSSSQMIASLNVEDVTIDQNGIATLILGGELPGGAVLDYSVSGTDVTATSKVEVVMNREMVATPMANISSGQTIASGTQIVLTCSTPDATIYYTLDGSCPCNEATRHKYEGPITISTDVIVKAIAVKDDMDDSDIATFIYIVNGINDIKIAKGLKATYADGQLFITGAEGSTVRVYDLQGHELATRSRISNRARINVPKTDVYVISVTFANEQTVVHKIMAK